VETGFYGFPGGAVPPSYAPAGAGYNASLAANVVCTTSNQFYDGPSLALPAGTWFISWKMNFRGDSGGVAWGAKLWDGGSAVYDVSETNGIFNQSVGGATRIVLGTPTTIKLSGATNAGSAARSIVASIAPDFASPNVATSITAIPTS